MTESNNPVEPRRGALTRALGSTWLKVALAAGVIYALVSMNRIDLRTFHILAANWGWLVLALALMLPPYLIVSYRFHVVLRNQGIDATFSQAVRWTMIGSFFDIVMPSNSGGDVVKAGYIVKHAGAGGRTRGVMAVAFDRVLGLLGLFLLAGMASIAGWNSVRALRGGEELVLFIALVCIGALTFLRLAGSRTLQQSAGFRRTVESIPAGGRILQLMASFHALRERPRDLSLTLGLSVLNHVFWCAAALCVARAFGYDLGVIQGLTFLPLAIFGNVFGFAGGFGVGTAAFDWIFGRAFDIQVGAAIGLTFQSLSTLSRLSGLPFYLASAQSRRLELQGNGA